MYLSRSRTGNIFPYRTVVVLRHHVYVPEFHDPSCYSVGTQTMRLINLSTTMSQLQHMLFKHFSKSAQES
jgi:hypothetical protein